MNPYKKAEVVNWFKTVPVNDLVPQKRVVIQISADDTLAAAWKTLNDNQILGAPVIDKQENSSSDLAESTTGGRMIGVLEVHDVVRVLFTPLDDKALYKDSLATTMLALLEKIIVRDIVSSDESCGKLHSLSENASLYDVMQYMVGTGAQRVTIVNTQRQLSNIVTQSMIVDFLAANRAKIHDIAELKSEQVSFHNVWGQVLTFDHKETALHAFRKMRASHACGAAVVDEGKLIGNISERDLKIIGSDAAFFSSLLLPLSGFCAYVVQQRPKQAKSAPAALAYQKDASLEQVIAMLSENHVHRVYLVSESKEVLGESSLLDVIKLVVA